MCVQVCVSMCFSEVCCSFRNHVVLLCSLFSVFVVVWLNCCLEEFLYLQIPSFQFH